MIPRPWGYFSQAGWSEDIIPRVAEGIIPRVLFLGCIIPRLTEGIIPRTEGIIPTLVEVIISKLAEGIIPRTEGIIPTLVAYLTGWGYHS